jgi:hypothetical protein
MVEVGFEVSEWMANGQKWLGYDRRTIKVSFGMVGG